MLSREHETSKYFLHHNLGKPAKQQEKSHIDWAPTLFMNGEANKQTIGSLPLETVDDNVSDLPDRITEEPYSYMH